MKNIQSIIQSVIIALLFCVLAFSSITCNDSSEEEKPNVSEDPVSVEEKFMIDDSGGTFILPSGIIVTIPEGAVIESKEIKVDNLILEDAQALDSIITTDDSPFLFGITISTDKFNFKKPIKVRIPVQNLDETGLPVLYELQGENNKWLFSDETIIVSYEEKYVEIILKESTDGGSRKSANESTDAVRVFLSQFYTGVFGIDGSILLPENPCRKLRFSTIVENIDIENSGEGCEGKTVIERYTYLDCEPAINGYFQISKISPSCKPQITTSAPDELEVGQSGSIAMSLTLGDEIPLPEQEIKLVGKKLLSVSPGSQTTRSGGEAPPFKVQAGDEAGDGLVTGTVSLDYYLTFISAYDSETGEVEFNGKEYDHVKKDIDVAIAITVVGLPKILTTFSTNDAGTVAIVGGEVTEHWEIDETERGVYLNDEKIPLGKGLGSFSTERQDFEQGIINELIAFATNRFGTSYGEKIRFVVDIDGNIYTVVTIGEQEWIGENLKTTRYNDGGSILYITDGYEWNHGGEKYCWYDNNESNKYIYGALYNILTVKTGKLCPVGWHVPSTDEYLILAEYAGGAEIAGGKLKEKGTAHWHSPNTGATNEFGFTALPGGYRHGLDEQPLPGDTGKDFYSKGIHGAWFTSTRDGNNLYYVGLSYNYQDAGMRYSPDLDYGASIRCVKD